jgi:hypothetical protein
MKDPPAKRSIPLRVLSACCPEAQADGVPCTELGRDCESCQRAVTAAATPGPDPDRDKEERDDSWAV